jgi:F-type H+-transporting ATPase subunit delta
MYMSYSVQQYAHMLFELLSREKTREKAAAAFVRLLEENHAVSLAPRIVDVYEKIRSEKEGVVSVSVESALPLSAELRKEIEHRVKTTYGKQAEIDESVDASLVGGMRVRIGDAAIDSTIATKIQQMKKLLSN